MPECDAERAGQVHRQERCFYCTEPVDWNTCVRDGGMNYCSHACKQAGHDDYDLYVTAGDLDDDD